jgi:hypothetical protein
VALRCSDAYEASDGWLFVGARASDLPRPALVDGLAGIDGLSGEEVERALAARFVCEAAAVLVERLTAATPARLRGHARDDPPSGASLRSRDAA